MLKGSDFQEDLMILRTCVVLEGLYDSFYFSISGFKGKYEFMACMKGDLYDIEEVHSIRVVD